MTVNKSNLKKKLIMMTKGKGTIFQKERNYKAYFSK
jgi:hypothetical protein